MTSVCTVLLIEDNPDDVAEARRLLLAGSERRYAFREALSGAAGIAMALADPPDCVVLDYNLPDMDALEVLAGLAGPDGLTVCPVMVLTGSSGNDKGPRVLRAGAQDYLGKGWMTSESMTHALENTIERHRLTRELRAADERLLMAAQMGGLGWFERDFVTGRGHWSEGLERIFGLAPGTYQGGEADSYRMIHPDDHARIMAAMTRAREDGAPFHEEMRIRRADGTEAWIETRADVQRDHTGRVVKLLGVTLDITDKRRAEAALRQTHKLEAVGRLAGGIAHSFNNMMTIILGNIEELPESAPDHPLHEAAQDIREAGERAARLTRQLLAFARKQRLSPTVFALDAVVGEIASMLSRAMGSAVRVVTELEPCRVRADAGQIEQVLVNLALNAKDAMPRGGTLTVSTAPQGAFALLEVSDTGRGMDAATLAKAFDPFFTTKPFGESAGLGLSTAEGIVSQSGGRIEAESEPGRGTKIRVLLPLA